MRDARHGGTDPTMTPALDTRALFDACDAFNARLRASKRCGCGRMIPRGIDYCDPCGAIIALRVWRIVAVVSALVSSVTIALLGYVAT